MKSCKSQKFSARPRCVESAVLSYICEGRTRRKSLAKFAKRCRNSDCDTCVFLPGNLLERRLSTEQGSNELTYV